MGWVKTPFSHPNGYTFRMYSIIDVVSIFSEPLETELEEAVTSLLHEIPLESRQSLIATAILVLESEAGEI